MKHYRNIKPTWSELEYAELVYYSKTLKTTVISRAIFNKLLYILHSEFNLTYHLPNDRNQPEITQEEYENMSQRATRSFSCLEFICYEESAREQEIREQIIRKLKNK